MPIFIIEERLTLFNHIAYGGGGGGEEEEAEARIVRLWLSL